MDIRELSKSLHDNNLKFENGKIVKNIKDYLL